MPRCGGSALGSCFATTMNRSPICPFEMNVFEPFRTYELPSLIALVCTFARSEPVPGSVIAMPRMTSPEIAPGRYFCFCASVPNSVMYGMQMSECSDIISPCARTYASSSMTIASYRKSAPAPP